MFLITKTNGKVKKKKRTARVYIAFLLLLILKSNTFVKSI